MTQENVPLIEKVKERATLSAVGSGTIEAKLTLDEEREYIPKMIDHLVADIPSAHRGFRLLFSAAPFPGYQRKLTRLRQDLGGWWYSSDEPEAEGWLCPALFRYFHKAPKAIYVKAESKR